VRDALPATGARSHHSDTGDGCRISPQRRRRGGGWAVERRAVERLGGLRETRGKAQRSKSVSLVKLVGLARFELATPATQTRCATKLRYSPCPDSLAVR
jgi:hypothetical protein